MGNTGRARSHSKDFKIRIRGLAHICQTLIYVLLLIIRFVDHRKKLIDI